MQYAANGTWQEPPSARDTARSAMQHVRVSASFKNARKGRTALASRTSIPKAPCPGAGRLISGSMKCRMRSESPNRFKPAPAITSASNSPRSSFAKRVPTLPRIEATLRCGNFARSISSRRRLDVPTTAPAGSAFKLSYCGDTKASRGSSRTATAASTKPPGNSIGTSFKE